MLAIFAAMHPLKTTSPLALKVLLTEDLFLVDDSALSASVPPTPEKHMEAQPRETESEPMSDQPAGAKSEEKSGYSHFDYLGENNKYFVVVVNYPGQQFIEAKDLDALNSILQAKKMELRDVAVLNAAKYPGCTLRQIKDFFVNTRLVLLGITAQELEISGVSMNKITSFDGVQVLVSYSFPEMQADSNKKRAFWNEMKIL